MILTKFSIPSQYVCCDFQYIQLILSFNILYMILLVINVTVETLKCCH